MGNIGNLFVRLHNVNAPFISLNEALERARLEAGTQVTNEVIDSLVESRLLPNYPIRATNERAVIATDLRALMPIIVALGRSGTRDDANGTLFASPRPPLGHLVLGDHTEFNLGAAVRAIDDTPALLPALRALSLATADVQAKGGAMHELSYLGEVCLRTCSPAIGNLAEAQVARQRTQEREMDRDFAGSAHYMGSKRRLGGFLVEALATVLPPDGYVLDLMCGSGAATSAFSKHWQTFASDAQVFCRLLARIQAGGNSYARAESMLRKILPVARAHSERLRHLLGPWLDEEDDLLHRDVDDTLLDKYRAFLRAFPLFPHSEGSGTWNPTSEVRRRQGDPRLQPACLFTAYFANIYFGLRQAVEIDSLRAAIDALGDPKDQEWALGALIVATSMLGTTYAAHFAQPPIKDPDDLTLPKLSRVLERRARSISHEFSVRLLNLAEQSERYPRPVELLPGPWRVALDSLVERTTGGPVAVYVDAPYTRDEYSRYYHVLETLVQYKYPDAIGSGRMPTRGSDRFVSELFTRDRMKMGARLTDIIVEVLRRDWLCAWSYSDSGLAPISSVIEDVQRKVPRCDITSFAVPLHHHSHGRRSRKRVTEYLVLFVPKKR